MSGMEEMEGLIVLLQGAGNFHMCMLIGKSFVFTLLTFIFNRSFPLIVYFSFLFFSSSFLLVNKM